MITEQEFTISNKNYVDKDFPVVYSELLDLCEKISTRWNPDTSNESDPGIVLLKLLAFIADKNNYNIDKNVLECFLPSATQETSARNLFEMNGYDMKYYVSSTTPVSFLYTNDLPNSFTLKKYDTVLTSSDGNINYTLIEDCQISYKNVTYTANAIEGTVEFLTVGDLPIIQLNNLDDNNRIYFPESMIAQNGIFITQENSSIPWTKVNNLHTQELGTKCYKFSFDSSKNLPYVEFPEDISNLIGTGLTIRYIVTRGAEGNISANTLTTLSSPDKMYDNTSSQNEILNFTDYLTINNLSSSSNGENPETIDEAYVNFKRTVGTFNTLVTPRDYANFIYNITNPETLKFIVSNIQVSDRRTDFNYSNNIVTYTAGNNTHIVYNTANTEDEADNDYIPVITPFEVVMYPLKPITTSYTEDNFNASFTPLGSQFIETDPNLSEAKCLSTDYKELDSQNDIYCFKNKYILNAKVSTYDKVDYIQQQEIISNIKESLFRNFNARMVEFGEEIPYDEILNVIQNSDSRINNVRLDDPAVVTYIMDSNGNESLLSGDGQLAERARGMLSSKSVLNGRVNLFDFNTDFNINYGQRFANNTQQVNDFGNSTYVGVLSAETTSTISNASLKSSSGYKIKSNEVIQFISPNMESEKEYGVYVNYRFESDNVEYIEANTTYQLTGDDKLRIVYSDSDTGIEYNIIYTNNSIITNGSEVTVDGNWFRPTFNLYVFDENDITRTTRTITYGSDTLGYWVLGANEVIKKMVYVTTLLNNAYLPCYWITNSDNNILFDSNDLVQDGSTYSCTRLLQNGEYFMYSNKDLTELVILGSGTKLTLTNIPDPEVVPFVSWKIDKAYLLDIEDINNNGLAAFSSVNWQNKQLISTPIKVDEMEINTFTEGDTVKISKNLPVSNLTNDFVYVVEATTVTATHSDGTITRLVSDGNLQVRSRLDLNFTTGNPQKILSNQTIKLYTEDNNYTLNGNNSNPILLSFNYNVQYPGSPTNGAKIDITKRNVSGITVTILGGLKALVYKEGDHLVYPVSTNPTYSGVEITPNKDGMYPISLSGFGGSITTEGVDTISTQVLRMKKDILFMAYYDAAPTTSAVVTISSDNGIISKYRETPSQDSSGNYSVTLSTGMNIICIHGNNSGTESINLTIDHTNSSNDNMYLSSLSMINNINPKLLSDQLLESTLMTYIDNLATKDGVNIFYYLNSVDNERAIDFATDETIFTPRIFWDKNNIANRFTIGQIDFNNSIIEVLKASQK